MNAAFGDQTVDESAYMNTEEARQVSLIQSSCVINSLYIIFSINFIKLIPILCEGDCHPAPVLPAILVFYTPKMSCG